jgi:hypothetical protein
MQPEFTQYWQDCNVYLGDFHGITIRGSSMINRTIFMIDNHDNSERFNLRAGDDKCKITI